MTLLATVAVGQSPVAMPQRGLCAHRGCMDTHPESTLPAFRQAIALGAHMIEFDVQLSRDSQMVVMHDATVDRTTTGTGNVADLSLAELRKLDAGAKKDARFAGTPVPTFEEVLAIMPRNVWLNCHLKGGADVGRAAALLLQKTGRLHQAFLACGEEAAAGARQAVPSVLICNSENKYRRDTRRYVEATIAARANFIQLLRAAAGEDRTSLMADLKKADVKINYYYATGPAELPGLFSAGVDFVLVNNLAECMPAAAQIGMKAVNPIF